MCLVKQAFVAGKNVGVQIGFIAKEQLDRAVYYRERGARREKAQCPSQFVFIVILKKKSNEKTIYVYHVFC